MIRSVSNLASFILLCVFTSCIVSLIWAKDKKTEPTNAKEAAAKKAEQTAEVNQKLADWKEGAEMKTALEQKNAMVARVMKEHGAEIDDLFTFITPHLSEAQNPKDVHFNGKGYDLLGKQVAKSISQILEKSDTK